MTKKQLIEKLALIDCDEAEIRIFDQQDENHSPLIKIEVNFPAEGAPYVVLY